MKPLIGISLVLIIILIFFSYTKDSSTISMTLSTPEERTCFEQCLMGNFDPNQLREDENFPFQDYHICNQRCNAKEQLGDPNNGYQPVTP